jgi:hypothetical protein
VSEYGGAKLLRKVGYYFASDMAYSKGLESSYTTLYEPLISRYTLMNGSLHKDLEVFYAIKRKKLKNVGIVETPIVREMCSLGLS